MPGQTHEQRKQNRRRDAGVARLQSEGLTRQEIAEKLGISFVQVKKALMRERRRGEVAERSAIEEKAYDLEDKKFFTEADVEEYIVAMINLQHRQEAINTRQVKTTVRINDAQPIAIAYWSDWHIGAGGTDYNRFEADLRKIRDTEGLYFIGGGDYKDNYVAGSPPGGQFEQIIQPGMQDISVKHYMKQVKDKALALIRGCHDDWDKKTGDSDFIEELCEVTGAVNLWHGGEVIVKLGAEEYLWRCRHKYKYQSSLNLENAMRRINEIQGPCDVAAEAHLHNPYTMFRHLMGDYRIMMRSGSYKVWDEYGQKLAGYKGKPGVPVVIMFPETHRMIPITHLDDAIPILSGLRRRA